MNCLTDSNYWFISTFFQPTIHFTDRIFSEQWSLEKTLRHQRCIPYLYGHFFCEKINYRTNCETELVLPPFDFDDWQALQDNQCENSQSQVATRHSCMMKVSRSDQPAFHLGRSHSHDHWMEGDFRRPSWALQQEPFLTKEENEVTFHMDCFKGPKCVHAVSFFALQALTLITMAPCYVFYPFSNRTAIVFSHK